jgi:hypothetical protein
MSEADSPREAWAITLRAFPLLAERVGNYTACFAMMETALWLLYARVLGCNTDGALALLGHIESFSIKLTAIESFLPHSALSQDIKERCSEIFRTARECNAFRNKLAHGIYSTNAAADRVILAAFAMSTSRSKVEIELTVDFLRAELNKVSHIQADIANLFSDVVISTFDPKHQGKDLL